MSRDPSYVLDIITAFKLAQEFARGLSRRKLEEDLKTQSAILHQIMLAGEAVKRISSNFRKRHAKIPWKKIAGMRDKLIHEYDDVDLDLVWDTVTRELPELTLLFEELLP